MSTSNDNRDTDRDQNQQMRDRDQKQQSNDRDQNQNMRDRDQQQSNDRDQNQNMRDQNQQRNDHDHQHGTEGRNQDSNANLEGRWNDIQSDYRKRYPSVTDEDVNFRTGEFDSMTDRLAKRTNRSRDQVSDEIRNWKGSNDENQR